MVYKNFTLQLTMRIALILANMALILYPNFRYPIQNVLFLTLIFTFTLFAQVYALFRYLGRSHRLLNNALEMMNADLYSISPSGSNQYHSLDELNSTLNKTIDSFKNISNKYQSQLNYLELLIENIDTGIISINENNKIVLQNSAIKKMLGIEKINYLDDISPKHSVLSKTIEKSNHNRHFVTEIKIGEQKQQISIKISALKLLGKTQKLVTFHNISTELARTESEAWSRLLQVLNHEIFNSVTPLSSLSNTMKMIIKNNNGRVKTQAELKDEEIQDIAESIETIHLRSSNLINFINGFKKLAKVPPPKIEQIKIIDLLKHIAGLFNDELNEKGIDIQIIAATDLEINADRNQLEQALINLISNSIYALEGRENKKIVLASSKFDQGISLSVRDNGKGISVENLDRIFVPYFSTRKNGTGIGLSLSRYLIQLNNGRIRVKSEPNEGAEFIIEFN